MATNDLIPVDAIIAVTYTGGGLLPLGRYILVGLMLLKLGQSREKTHHQKSS